MTSSAASPVVNVNPFTIPAPEPYGATGPTTLYQLSALETATIESVYLSMIFDGSVNIPNGAFTLRLLDQSGLPLYMAASPYIVGIDLDFGDALTLELTWARGAGFGASQTPTPDDPSGSVPQFAWATMPLPNFTMKPYSSVVVEGFIGWKGGMTDSPDAQIQQASVVLTDLGATSSTVFDVTPLLLPQATG